MSQSLRARRKLRRQVAKLSLEVELGNVKSELLETHEDMVS